MTRRDLIPGNVLWNGEPNYACHNYGYYSRAVQSLEAHISCIAVLWSTASLLLPYVLVAHHVRISVHCREQVKGNLYNQHKLYCVYLQRLILHRQHDSMFVFLGPYIFTPLLFTDKMKVCSVCRGYPTRGPPVCIMRLSVTFENYVYSDTSANEDNSFRDHIR